MLYCVLWILIASNFANLTHAQDWPRRPVRMVVPFAAGGGNDISARIIAQPLTEELGQQFIIDKLHAAVARVTLQQNVRDAFVKAQVPMAVSASPAEFEAYTRAEVQRWAKIIREHNVTFQ